MYALALLNTHSVAKQRNNTHPAKWSDIPKFAIIPFAFHFFFTVHAFSLKRPSSWTAHLSNVCSRTAQHTFCGQAMQQHTSCQMVWHSRVCHISPFAFHYFFSLFRPFLLKGLHLGLPTCQMYALALLNTHSVAKQCNNTHPVKWSDIPEFAISVPLLSIISSHSSGLFS